MGVLDYALELATTQNIRFFPVCSNSKIPAWADFPKKATSDPLKLQKIFNDSTLNSGIACGKISEGLYLVGFDIDNKPGKKGYETLAELEKMGRHFPQTWSQKTPTGGEHRLYWSPVPLRQGVDICGPGIDFRSDGGYLVGPGSSIHGKLYEPFHKVPIVQFPDWAIKDFQKTAKVISLNKNQTLPVKDQILALKRGVEFLASLETVSIGARNDAGYKTICQLKDFGIDSLQILDLLLQHWKCEPMLELNELTHIINSVYTYSKSPSGVIAPEVVFPDDINHEITTPRDAVPSRNIIGEFNQKHLVVNENGKAMIYKETRDEALGRNVLQRFTFEDFKKLHCNEFVEKGNKVVPAADAWLQHPKRRQYMDGTIFDPTNTSSKTYYNLWRGWSIEPIEGEFPQIDRFLRDVICGNDPELYKYLMGWLALMFQHPEKPGEVAIVFKGLKGTGKSTLAEFLLDIMGQHGMEISQPGQLTGRFLSHLRDAVFVVANESFWSGDRQAEGQLKSIVTNKYLSLEGKFQAPITVKNVVHLMFTTNDHWAVPASMGDERRFAIFEVSRMYMQNRKYFSALRDEAYNRGGLGAMLHYFLNYDISTFDPTEVPNNSALTDQKIRSLRGPEKWLFEALSSGTIAGYEWGNTSLEISKNILYQHYTEWSREYSPQPMSQWGKALWQHLKNNIENYKPHGEPRVLKFGSLEKCREEFIRQSGLVGVEWGDEWPKETMDDLI